MSTRKEFLRTCLVGTTGIVLLPQLLQARQDPKPVPLDAVLVKDFVAKAHKDTETETVKEMLKKFPTLLNASWDWGGGDFETAIGAASHTGNIDVVNHLVEKGAQLNFLTLCVLGKTELVKNLLTAMPGLINMIGPHGFTPLHHANKGGENALEVKKLLESLGAKETRVQLAFPKP
jgi:ankyrin repeat protein